MPKKDKKWKSFGQRIQALRENQGLSLEELAHETGYPLDILEEIENDNTVPPVSLVIQLSHIFKIDVDQLESVEEKKAFPTAGQKSQKKGGFLLVHSPVPCWFR